MSISISSTVTPAVPQGTVPELALQPGTVVDAQVVKLLANNLVQIAIADLSLSVISEVPLQIGQTLQLAVTQAQDGSGIKLAVVGQGAVAGEPPADATGNPSTSLSLTPNAPAATTLSASVSAQATVPAASAPSIDSLTPVERQAVITATQTAAPQQASLAPLFANLSAAISSNTLPPPLQQAIAQVLAQRTNLDQNLDASDIRNAVQKSGLFFEASLAAGTASAANATPDLKGALIVLRQTLASLSTTASPEQNPTAPARSGGTLIPNTTATIAEDASAAVATETSQETSGSLPNPETPAATPQQARITLTEALGQSAAFDWLASAVAQLEGAPQAATTGAALNLLQEALQGLPRDVGEALAAFTAPGNGSTAEAAQRANVPPPFRGALPAVQAIASPSIVSDAPLSTTARHLLEDTDAAIARQTLLQVASLPDRADGTVARADQTPKWNFEIPFATPQGTAMAQFEISRDGGGREAEAAKKAWRARFSINVEPAGPVHALVTLTGDKTSVRMWAERPATATQLREGAAQLGQALSRAELQPGDIVIREGAPPQSVPAAAGHFLDRAL